MEALIELLVEVFGEFVIEVIVHFFVWLLSYVITDIDSKPHIRKRIKIIVYFICLISCVVLLVLGLIYAKTAYAMLASIFISLNIFILGIKILNEAYFNNKKATITTIVLTRISRITFYVLVFIFLDTLKTTAAKATLISISSTLMFIFMCIDIYRIWKYYRAKKDKKDEVKMLL